MSFRFGNENIAEGLQGMLNEIMIKFITEDQKEEYNEYCKKIINKNRNVFDCKFIKEVQMGKKQMREKIKEKLVENGKKKKAEIRSILINNIIQSPPNINEDIYNQYYQSMEEILTNLEIAINLEKVNYHKNIKNKIFIGKLLNDVKSNIPDMNDFMAYLSMKEIQISKSEIYFAIKLFKLFEKFSKIHLLTLPLRFIKSNFAVIEEILEEEVEFWK